MSVQPADVRQHLDRLLTEETRLLTELESVLTREADVVRGDDPGAIEHIGGARHHCVGALIRLDADRAATCKMLSFGSGADGIERLFAWCDEGHGLHRRWQANLVIARRCKELNDRNGAVVSVKLGQVQRRLANIRGGSASPVYGRQGARFEGIARREFGQA